MIRKSELGAIAVIAALGLASPAFAQTHANAGSNGPIADPSSPHLILAANDSSSANGGGSAGYNHQVGTDYRLKQHSKSRKTGSGDQPAQH